MYHIPWERPRPKLVGKIVFLDISIYLCIYTYIAHHFILLQLNPFALSVDREWSWFQHYVIWLRVLLSADGANNVSWHWLSPLRGWGTLIMGLTGKFVYIAHHFTCYGSFSLILVLIGRNGGLSIICHRFDY